MRLTPDEYRRGLIKWQAAIPISISTETTDDPGAPHTPSAPLTQPGGSKVESPPGQYTSIGIHMLGPVLDTRTVRVFWERLVGPRLDTAVWDGDLRFQAARLHHVPNYGFFHRLVVLAPTLLWDPDVIYRVEDAIVRFANGDAEIERVNSDDQVQIVDGQPRFHVTQETATIAGRFVDIVAPGATAAEAELRAYGILGMLALCLGENVVGEIASSEPYEVLSAVEQRGTSRAFIRAKYPRLPEPAELDQVDFLLGLLLKADQETEARVLALRWYEKAIRAEAPADKLLSFFVGIEALVTTFADTHGPVPQADERQVRYKPFLDALKGTLGKEDRGFALQRLVDPTLAERFGFYLTQRGLDPGLGKRFRELRRLRNLVIHGDVADVTFDEAGEGERVLRALLKSELGLLGEMAWEKHPSIHSFELKWQYQQST